MVQIKGLTRYYGQTCAVDNLNFEIPKGQILGLLGPNGAGKTTTLRILTGYLQPTSGTIYVDGIDVREDPLGVKKMIGYLPESSPIYPDMIVFDYLIFIAEMRGLDKDRQIDRIKELAEICSLTEVMHKTVMNLSKGYKQRVGLALALMSDPDILVLDEPTSGLDPNQIVEIRSIIKEIGKTKTIIFSTHILSEAEATCDRVVIINNGAIAADGATEVLKSSEGGTSLISLTLQKADQDDVESVLNGFTGIQETAFDTSGDALDVRLSCTEDIRAVLYGEIKKKDWILLEFKQERKSLEHIFRELTKDN
ncbi:MAG: ABC transporter ATP-binding protein [Spirochaetes bacterium]|nr:MAG: ABC transporter ATP-binding protein [Spirochaetota bacterium]